MPTCHLKCLKSSTNSPNFQGSLQSSHSKITAFLRDAPSTRSATSYQGHIYQWVRQPVHSSHYTWWTVNSWLFCRCLQHLKAKGVKAKKVNLPLQITLICCYWWVGSPYEKYRVWGCKSLLNVLYSFQSVPYLRNTNLEVSWVWMFGSGRDCVSSCS